MKTGGLFFLSFCFFAFHSCTYHDFADPELNYIRATINGVNTEYRIVREEQDVMYNYIRPGSILMTFQRDHESTVFWTVSIIFGNAALDIDDLPLPFAINGPTGHLGQDIPEFYSAVTDPFGAPYGKVYAIASTYHHDVTFTIHSVRNNLIKGTFEGTGFGEFTKGEFSAQLPRRPL